MTPASPARPRVIVVHGLGASRFIMGLLCWRIARWGNYRVVNFGYRSLRVDIEEAARQLAATIREALQEDVTSRMPLHFVAHSMGGLVLRMALSMIPVPFKGRIVFFATPHLGTHWGDRFAGVLRWIPALAWLGRRETSFCHKVPMPYGWVYGTVGGRFDWLVPDHLTKLPGEADHATVWTSHTMIFRRTIARSAVDFLTLGRFRANFFRRTTQGKD